MTSLIAHLRVKFKILANIYKKPTSNFPHSNQHFPRMNIKFLNLTPF